MNKILVIRLKGLGDIIHLLPSLKIIRDNFKNANITFLCQKPFGDIIPPNLEIETIQISPNASFWEMLYIIRKIRKQKFDILFDLYCNSRTALISLLSNIPKRVGFNYRIRKYAYTHLFTPADPNKYLTYLFRDFFAEFEINGKLESVRPFYNQENLEWAKSIIKSSSYSGGILLGVNFATTYPSKKWPINYFIDFIKRWYYLFGEPVLLFYGPNEYNEAKYIHDCLSHATILPLINSLRDFVALVSLCNLFITADTGPMHIAVALDIPTIALFGPTTRKAVAPNGNRHLVIYNENLSCLECHKESCDNNKCMQELTPEIVWQKVCQKYLNHEIQNFQKNIEIKILEHTDNVHYIKMVQIAPNELNPEKILNISNSQYTRKAIFIDRDGTINPDYGYISNPKDFELYPDVGKNLKKLKDQGFLLILITNQSGIFRKLIKIENLLEIHKKLQNILYNDFKVIFDGIYVCPHYPYLSQNNGYKICICRKPGLGMIYQAVLDFKICISKSVVVGDKISDVKLGHVCQIKSILLDRDKKYTHNQLRNIVICNSFDEVTQTILSNN